MKFLNYSQTTVNLNLHAPIFKEHKGDCKVTKFTSYDRKWMISHENDVFTIEQKDGNEIVLQVIV